jgi:hypothetical protein
VKKRNGWRIGIFIAEYTVMKLIMKTFKTKRRQRESAIRKKENDCSTIMVD